MEKRGQGTIEYLVIIAIVVVIALVVVGLLLQIMGNFGGMSESSARAAWKSGTPFAIADYAQTSTTVTLVLQNTSGQTLTFDYINVAATDINTTNKTLSAGETYTITVTDASQTCTNGAKYSYPKTGIVINYDTPNISDLNQLGVADITGTCS